MKVVMTKFVMLALVAGVSTQVYAHGVGGMSGGMMGSGMGGGGMGTGLNGGSGGGA
ncbi:MAG: hypothetical protein QOJ04_722 [Caballeronia sp.]|jgi:hypothetical protein|nr:hypothetical protein [Caballeronia sp.]MEA3111699.1 hypothetical protein [Caballeronia sp.]